VSQKQAVILGDRWFWAYDVSLGVFLKHLVEVAERRLEGRVEPWLGQAVGDWRTAAVVADVGLTLAVDWSPVQKRVVAELVDAACALVEKRGVFPAFEIRKWTILDGLHPSIRSADDVPAAPVVEVGRAIGALLTGRELTSPSEHEFIYGAGAP